MIFFKIMTLHITRQKDYYLYPLLYMLTSFTAKKQTCSEYDTKLYSDYEGTVLEIWGVLSTSSLPLLRGSLWRRSVDESAEML